MLMVDDEKNIRESVKSYLELEKIETITAENGLSAQRLLEQEPFSAGIIDLKMPGMDGMQLLKWIQKKGPYLPVIIISAYGEIKDAVEAMKMGAEDYIVKPFDPEELVIRLKKVIEKKQLRDRVEMGSRLNQSEMDLVGDSPPLRKIKEIIRKISPTPTTVLITGESGTGKEVIARAIHGQSNRSSGPFIAVNIGGVPETLLESELFGFERGAFTGADKRKIGIFELATGGTLFLDEIGDAALPLQIKLLRVIQEKKLQRLGGTQMIPIDVRIIAATNRNMEAKVEDGSFREDLFYRLNVIRIEVPPLREHREDIPVLSGRLIEEFNRKLGKKIEGVDPEALQSLNSYSFPGNVRELENIIERAIIFADTDNLKQKDLNLSRKPDSSPLPETRTLSDLERQAIIDSLHRWEGNRTRAAKELGITRRTLFNKLKEYGLDD